MELTTHYMIYKPENDQCYAICEELPFNKGHFYEATGLSALAYDDLKTPCKMPRTLALELVNKWNRMAESYRYWIEPSEE